MIKYNRFHIFFPLLISVPLFTLCTSLSEIKLNENPDFMKNAQEYTILHPLINPLTHTSRKPQPFTFEKQQPAKIIQTNVLWSMETEREGYIEGFKEKPQHKNILDWFFNKAEEEPRFDESDMQKGDVARIKDYNYHRVEISSDNQELDYIVLGQVVFSRRVEKETEKTTFEQSNINYPVEYFIFQNDNQIGNVLVENPLQFSSSTPALKIKISLREKLFDINYQEQFNKINMSVEVDKKLVALFDLKPAAFISTKMKGVAKIDQDISTAELNDIFDLYILANIANLSLRLSEKR